MNETDRFDSFVVTVIIMTLLPTSTNNFRRCTQHYSECAKLTLFKHYIRWEDCKQSCENCIRYFVSSSLCVLPPLTFAFCFSSILWCFLNFLQVFLHCKRTESWFSLIWMEIISFGWTKYFGWLWSEELFAPFLWWQSKNKIPELAKLCSFILINITVNVCTTVPSADVRNHAIPEQMKIRETCTVNM